jgi:4-hydroxythreonine-4-phosphate dehydrogenase
MHRRGGGRPKIVITMGDPSGIGPEITSAALRRVKDHRALIIVGDRGVFDRVNRRKSPVKAEFIDLANVDVKRFSFGKISAEYGKASIEYLDVAMALILDGAAEAVVTCPISKEAIHLAGFSYSGHTEYFGEKACVDDEVMMLVNDRFKFSLVTRHVPLSSVAKAIDPVYMEMLSE